MSDGEVRAALEAYERAVREQARVAIEAEELWNQILDSDSADAAARRIARRYPELNENSLAVLDELDEEACRQVTADADSFHAVAAAVVRYLDHASTATVAARERRLRLLGLPQPTVKELLENDGVAELFFGEDYGKAGAVNHLGVRHAQCGDVYGAIRIFSAAIAICPIHAEPLMNRGKAYLMVGSTEAGLADYEKAYPFSGGDPEVGGILRRHGRRLWGG